jgi:hypothetical protein
MIVTASRLREDVYNILDTVLETGWVLRIVADTTPSRLARLKKRDCIRGNSEDLSGSDWSKEWKPDL